MTDLFKCCCHRVSVAHRSTQQGQGLALNEIGGKLCHGHSQFNGLMRFQASRAACLARSQLRLDVPRLVSQSLAISDSTSSELASGIPSARIHPKP